MYGILVGIVKIHLFAYKHYIYDKKFYIAKDTKQYFNN